MIQRRKKEGKTDYKARLRILAFGKPRLAARLSLKNIIMQVIQYDALGDKVLVSAHSNELKKYGWIYSNNNLSAAYLVGLLMAVKAKKKKINEAIFDTGLRRAIKGNVLFAALKGAVDGGLDIPHSVEAFPNESRLKGEHVASYAKTLDPEKYKKLFSNYIKLNAKPEDMPKKFIEVKEKILRG